MLKYYWWEMRDTSLIMSWSYCDGSKKVKSQGSLTTYSLAFCKQTLQGLLPPHEDNKAWLWLSRLAFHFNKAFASLCCSVSEAEDAVARREVAIMNAPNRITIRSNQNDRSFMEWNVGNMNTMAGVYWVNSSITDCLIQS